MDIMIKSNEDDIINDKKKYTNIKTVNLSEHVMSSTVVTVIIISLMFVADFLFMKKRKTLELNLKGIYSFLIVGIILTIAEIFFVYWYNIETIYNTILESMEWKMTYERYLFFKTINNAIPNVVHNEFKKRYEESLKHVTIVMNLPIIILSVLLISIASGRVTADLKDAAAIIINVLLLVVTFGVTFVNLGTMQSEPFDPAEVAKNFDPSEDVHRFQENFDFTSEKKFISSFVVQLLVMFFISVMSLRFGIKNKNL